MCYIFVSMFTVIVFMIWYYKQKRKFRSLKNIPGPKPIPIIGNALDFGFNPVDQLKNLHRISETYKPFAKIWLGPKNLYIVSTDPEFQEFILSSPKYIKKSVDYDIFRPWLKNGLLLSNGIYWQNRRKILTPAFHFKILDGFVNIFNTQTNILIQRLYEHTGRNVFDVYPYITAYTLDTICETAMGAAVNAQNSADNEYVQAVKTVCTIAINRVFSSWQQFDMLFQLSSVYKKQQRAIQTLHDFTKSVIGQRRKKLFNKRVPVQEQADDVGMKRRQVFLDVLLTATIDGRPLTDEDIQQEVDTFMFEGHDTTASLITFTIYELARNPNVQDKIMSELREIFGDDKKYKPTLQDLNKMKYTELVLKETLRLYPSVPFMGRVLEEDVNYKGTIIPKDTIISLFTYGMHRREDLYPEATRFNPERFLAEKLVNNSFAYVPFSAGPRNCIGQKFAMYEAKCTISRIVFNFELLPADVAYDVQLSSEIILKSANGVHVQLKHRQLK